MLIVLSLCWTMESVTVNVTQSLANLIEAHADVPLDAPNLVHVAQILDHARHLVLFQRVTMIKMTMVLDVLQTGIGFRHIFINYSTKIGKSM